MQAREEPIDENNNDTFIHNEKPNADNSQTRRTNLLADMRKRKDEKTQEDKLPKKLNIDKCVSLTHRGKLDWFFSAPSRLDLSNVIIPTSTPTRSSIPQEMGNPANSSGSASSDYPGMCIPAPRGFCPSFHPGESIPKAAVYPDAGLAEHPHYSEHPA
eukprot:7750826-Heterocapsa_arctica.AAC.1